MHLNSYSIVAAVAVGLLTAGAYVLLNRLGDRQSAKVNPLLALSVAFGLSCVANGFASLLALVIYFGNIFTIIHVTYLWVTLSIPLAACLIYISEKHRSRLLLVFTVLCMALGPIGIYATHIEPFWLRVDEQELVVATIDSSFTIGVLADLQTTAIGDYELEAIERLLAREPDVVLIPGDLYQMAPIRFYERIDEFRAAIKRIAEEVPLVLLVSGNTDSVFGLRAITAGTNALVLDNETHIADIGGNTVEIAGITLFGHQHQAEAMLDSLDSSDADMTILLAHTPDEIRRIRERPVDLLVAGHTHGGQVAIPFLGPLVTASSVPRHVGAGGLNELYGTPIYVSTGVGRERGSAPQVRFGARPSIGVITIVPNQLA